MACQSVQGGDSHEGWNVNGLCFICSFFRAARGKPLDRFWRFVSQNTCSCDSCIPLGVRTTISISGDQNSPKLPKIGPNRHFLAKMPKSYNGYISKTVSPIKIQTSNFACRLTVRDNKPTNENFAKRGRGLGHVNYFSNFGTLLISRERLKIQTSNFAHGLTGEDAKSKKWKIGQKGTWPWSRALLFTFLDPPY